MTVVVIVVGPGPGVELLMMLGATRCPERPRHARSKLWKTSFLGRLPGPFLKLFLAPPGRPFWRPFSGYIFPVFFSVIFSVIFFRHFFRAPFILGMQ